MNLDNLNRWLTVGANLGVLIGIIFLIVEVQQNNLIARSQIRMDIAGAMRENIDMFRSPEAISITAKMIRGDQLNLEDRIFLTTTYRSEIRAWENAAYQYSIGFLDEEEIEIYRSTWKARAASCKEPIGREFYSTYQQFRAELRPSFRTEFDAYFSEFQCEN